MQWSTDMSSVDSGFPSDSDHLSTAHSSSYNSFGSQNGDAAPNGGSGLFAALNTPSGRNSSSTASGEILRMVLEEEEEEEEEEPEEMGRPRPRQDPRAQAASDVLTINAAVQTGGVMARHRLWSASVFLPFIDRPQNHKSFLQNAQFHIYSRVIRNPPA